MKEACFIVKGLHCNGCSSRTENALRSIPGVAGAAVTLATGRTSITYDPAKVDITDVYRCVEELGFTVEAPAGA